MDKLNREVSRIGKQIVTIIASNQNERSFKIIISRLDEFRNTKPSSLLGMGSFFLNIELLVTLCLITPLLHAVSQAANRPFCLYVLCGIADAKYRISRRDITECVTWVLRVFYLPVQHAYIHIKKILFVWTKVYSRLTANDLKGAIWSIPTIS